MPNPIIAIVGRPNVGKSTLFNRISHCRAAITKDVPGVTRDNIYYDAKYNDTNFTIMDTGGLLIGGAGAEDEMSQWIKKGVLLGIDEATVIIHLLDGKEGLMPDDYDIADIIQKSGKQTITVVNKIDAEINLDRIYDFYPIGKELFPVSAEHGFEFDELMEQIVLCLTDYQTIEDYKDFPKIAIIGRQNVGKSTIVNALLGKERMMVSPIGGTTRDAVDSICKYYGKEFVIIDTAGMRKRARVNEDIERMSVTRAIRSIDRCDVAIFVIDANAGIVDQDKKIAGLIEKSGKGMIVVFNKWDLIPENHEERYKTLVTELKRELWFLEYVPIMTVSALTKLRLTKIFPIIENVIEQRKKRITTGELNRLLIGVERNISSHKGKEVKLKYMTQVDIEPPVFAIFSNFPDAVKIQHLRHLERLIRQEYGFEGTPIRVFVKKKPLIERVRRHNLKAEKYSK